MGTCRRKIGPRTLKFVISSTKLTKGEFRFCCHHTKFDIAIDHDLCVVGLIIY